MQGFQLTFITEIDRRHNGKQMHKWLMQMAKELDIKGLTIHMSPTGIGRDGKLHSAHFIEMADQPIEVMMAVTPEQAESMFSKIEEEKANLFYIKTPVEFGTIGAEE